METRIKTIYYFPHPKTGGIERNLDSWLNCSATIQCNENYILSNIVRKKLTKVNTYKPRFSSLHEIVGNSCDDACKYNLIVFRNILWPLVWVIYLRILGYKNIRLLYRANNDPMHWFHERSIKRAVSEFVKIVILPFYDLVIFNSMELKDRCRIYNKRCIVIPNPIEFKPRIIFHSKSPEILYLGRDAVQKNIENLIAAMELIGGRVSLTIIGFENKKHRVPNNVKFVRWLEKIDFSQFSYIVVPSLYEGSPNALLEGLNNGLIPIVSPFKSGGSELIEAYKCASFVATDFSSGALGAAIMKAVNTNINFKTITPSHLKYEYFESQLQNILTNE